MRRGGHVKRAGTKRIVSHSLWADLGRALEALQAKDDRLTKLHQSVNKVQQSI